MISNASSYFFCMAAQYMLQQEKHPSEEMRNLHTFAAFAVHCLHKQETEVEMIRIIITKKWREEGRKCFIQQWHYCHADVIKHTSLLWSFSFFLFWWVAFFSGCYSPVFSAWCCKVLFCPCVWLLTLCYKKVSHLCVGVSTETETDLSSIAHAKQRNCAPAISPA